MKVVLIVDDEYAILETLQEFLEEEGFAVLAAGNGEQALERMQEQRPDIILMDVMMPILDGVETLERIRGMSELEDLPVLLMSSAPRGSIDASAEKMASGFLKKPFKLQLLLDSIRKLTGE